MNSSFGSAVALIVAIITTLVLAFVYAGSKDIAMDRVVLADDMRDFQAQRNPVTMTDEPTQQMATSTPVVSGENVVLWLNVSGFRSDYVEKASSTSFFDRMASDGSYTEELVPTFPTLQWPSLLSQATGVPVSGHGIPSNAMRHPETNEVLVQPTDLSLLKAEPIWTTAKRQGLSVLVHDWPMSQEQPDEHAADVFLAEFDDSLGDADRLNRLYDAWASFEGEKKFRLVMASLHDLEKAARTYGTREEDTLKAVETLDNTLKGFIDKVKENWDTLANPGDELYLVISTDHGMGDADKVVNLAELLGSDLIDKVDYVVDQSMAHLWFKPLPEGANEEDFLEEYDKELKARIYWRSFEQGSYPSAWNWLEGGAEVGDRVLVLKPGYTFTEATGSEPVFDPSEAGGPFAASGYAVSDSSRMRGQVFIANMHDAGGGSDLGKFDGTQMHPTVAEILEIESAEGVTAEAASIR